MVSGVGNSGTVSVLVVSSFMCPDGELMVRPGVNLETPRMWSKYWFEVTYWFEILRGHLSSSGGGLWGTEWVMACTAT
ncbi:hypothetical protein PR002_g12919 [Phytophthora rubi]|uniref:Uncharacterized protein n=1 Tax=Phytophthora rubi TaxID=129364 RepID=A0A6A3LHZ7_9STRA|nr:hypothetical protein PR002_g12919 [Phytophthora rubi]